MGVGRRQRACAKIFICLPQPAFPWHSGMGLASVYFFLSLDVARIIFTFWFLAVKIVKKYFQYHLVTALFLGKRVLEKISKVFLNRSDSSIQNLIMEKLCSQKVISKTYIQLNLNICLVLDSIQYLVQQEKIDKCISIQGLGRLNGQFITFSLVLGSKLCKKRKLRAVSLSNTIQLSSSAFMS